MLEHELHDCPDPSRVQRTPDAASALAWQAGRLDLLTTGELIARLYRRPGPWVLGLTRKTQYSRGLKFGVFYRGDTMTCAGLAGHLGWLSARAALRDQIRQREVSSAPTGVVQDLMKVLADLVEVGHPQAGFSSGLPILLEHALRATMENRP